MFKEFIRHFALRCGYQIVRAQPRDLDPGFWPHYRTCRQYTMTTVERMYALYKAVAYVVASNIPGAVVECGVWRGGSSMLCASALLERSVTDRQLYLYDTFQGMPEPTALDVSHRGEQALGLWRISQGERKGWCSASAEEVRQNMLSTGYPERRLTLVEGKVEDTLSRVLPDQIAILRLDTDWYESTYHELVNLFPRITPNGILLIDDYGYWEGARLAVDQYFTEREIDILLHRIDYSGRIAIKTA